MRIAIVGAGIAGALLAWRIRQQAPKTVLDIFTKDEPDTADASGLSGGMVRGFEVSVSACGQLVDHHLQPRQPDRLLQRRHSKGVTGHRLGTRAAQLLLLAPDRVNAVTS
jgi:protoporphyrinogen oxidase